MSMTPAPLLSQAQALLDQSNRRDGALHHEPSGVHLLRYHHETPQDITLYEPLLCLVLQGAKTVGTPNRSLEVRQGQSLLVSHTVPVTSRITAASAQAPYVALVLPLDLALLRELALMVPSTTTESLPCPFSVSLSQVDDAQAAALSRYLEHTQSPQTRSLLAPITLREVHARLLLGPHGVLLQKLLWHETTAHRVFKATQHIQSNLARAIVIKELAQQVGMSSSAFFEHFKSVTGTSPLQYQKDLRLLKAREALSSSNQRVSEIAFGVGYHNPAQFSREYARKFGHSPRQERTQINHDLTR